MLVVEITNNSTSNKKIQAREDSVIKKGHELLRFAKGVISWKAELSLV